MAVLSPPPFSTQNYHKGFVVALYFVGAVTLLCILGTILLAVLGRAIPTELSVTASAGMGAMVGSAATVVGQKPQ